MRFAQVLQLDHRHLFNSELAGRHDPGVPGDDSVLSVHQHGVGPAEFLDAGGHLGNLRIAVGAGVPRVVDQ